MIEVVVYKEGSLYITEIVWSGSIFIDWRKKAIAWSRNFKFSKLNMVREGKILKRIEVFTEGDKGDE